MGSVVKAGQYALSEERPMSVMQVLGLAGGPSQTANTRDISVIRMVGDEPTVTKVDLDRMHKRSDFAKNIPLQKGDIVFVPAKGEPGLRLTDIVAPFTALYYLTRIGK
jgi:protein involved in polysaccharide export with SLBB domain